MWRKTLADHVGNAWSVLILETIKHFMKNYKDTNLLKMQEVLVMVVNKCLQCSDTVGSASKRASVKNE